VLELVMAAAFGPLTNWRLEFLKTAKALYFNAALWGSDARLYVGRLGPGRWLRDRKSIVNVSLVADTNKDTAKAVFATRAMFARDVTAVLRGTVLNKVAVSYDLNLAPDVFCGYLMAQDLWSRKVQSPPRLAMSCKPEPCLPEFLLRLRLVCDAMPALRELLLADATDLSGLQFLRGSALRTLGLDWSRDLRTLDGVEVLPITSLKCTGCESLANLDALRATRLTQLDISWCDSLFRRLDISGMSALPLEHLAYEACPSDDRLATVALLSATLVHLNLGWSKITDAGLGVLGRSGMRLETLWLTFCGDITAAGLAHLADMPLLDLDLRHTSIKIEDCPPRLGHCIRVK
jgi:hypothetical protein